MASTVAFPGSRDVPLSAGPSGPRPTHLPFRRISMPSVPSATTLAQLRAINVKDNRISVASQQSFDSLAESAAANPTAAGGLKSSTSHSLLSNGNRPPRLKSRPSSLQPPPKVPTVTPGALLKRKKVLRELLDSEKTYLDGLEFISDHFLNPLVQAITEGRPLLSPAQMASIFSNFVDMLGFHQAFYTTLSSHLGPFLKSAPPPPSAFSPSSPSRAQPDTSSPPGVEPSPPIASLLAQHIPFLSMYTPFVTAYPTIMASLHNLTSQHSNGYSYQFATWLKEREADPRCGKFSLRDWLLTLVQRCPRYLLLVRDLVACTDVHDPELTELEEVAKMLEKLNTSINTSLQTQAITLQLLAVQKATPNLPIPFIEPGRTFIRRGPLFQTADRIERIREFFLFSDCLLWLSKGGEKEGATTAEEETFRQSIAISPSENSFSAASRHQSESEPPLRRAASSATTLKSLGMANQGIDEKWWFRGKVDLLNLDVVIPPASFEEPPRLEIHSPQMSFSLFCDTIQERDSWASAIRDAKQARLVAMNTTHINSTLTSSASNQHLRIALQALPYEPDPEEPLSPQKKKGLKKDKQKLKLRERRGHVEHFVPAIWVPDSKAESCMRCGGVFGWRRRRHHCRLCGKCVCASCSGKTFFITDVNDTKRSSKPARACNFCYDAVFPVLDPETPPDQEDGGVGHLPHYSSIGTLTALPFSKSTPSLALPQAIPASHPPPLHYELPTPVKRHDNNEYERPISGLDFLPISRPRMPGSRPSSEIRASSYTTSTTLSFGMARESTHDLVMSSSLQTSPAGFSPVTPSDPNSQGLTRPKITFAEPAIALHTTPVTARASMEVEGKSRRFSLVLGSKMRSPGANSKDNIASIDENRGFESSYAAVKLTDILVRK